MKYHRNTNEKFTKDGITKMKTFSSEELETITSALQKSLDYLHQQKTLTEQVGGLLDLLIPGDGHRLFTLGEWNRTPTLESEIIEWLGTFKTVKRTSGPGASRRSWTGTAWSRSLQST